MGGQRQRGQGAVEFALLLPVFLIIAGGIIQFGLLFYAYAQLLQATQDGVRYGAVLSGDDSSIIARVQQLSPGGSSTTVTVSTTLSPTSTQSVTAANRARGNVLQVTGRYAYTIAIPLIPQFSANLNASSSMMVE